MVEHFIIIFVVYVSTKSVVSFVRCVSGGGMDGSRKRKWLKRREEKREREFLSLNLFVVKRRRRGRLVRLVSSGSVPPVEVAGGAIANC